MLVLGRGCALLGVCILIYSVAVVVRCDLLVITGVLVLLMAMGDISCRVIYSVSIDSLFVVIQKKSVIVFVYVGCSSALLEVAICSAYISRDWVH